MESVSYKRSLVIGTLLGDACSRHKDTKARMKVEFIVSHSLAQSDLVEWKANEISRLYGKPIVVHYRTAWNQATFGITQGKRLRVIHDWFHRHGKKVITDKIRFMDHPIGLAMLLCDDGSIRKRKKTLKDGSISYLNPSITIATHCFDTESVERLLQHIDKLSGAKGYINPERRIRRDQKVEYNRINFNCENSRQLWEYANKWIPKIPSMLAKFAFAIERYGLN